MALPVSPDLNQDALNKIQAESIKPKTYIEGKVLEQKEKTKAGTKRALLAEQVARAMAKVKSKEIDTSKLLHYASNEYSFNGSKISIVGYTPNKPEERQLTKEEYFKEIEKMEKYLNTVIEDEDYDYDLETLMADIKKVPGAEGELLGVYLEGKNKYFKDLGDGLKSDYYYAIVLGIAAKNNPIEYGANDAKEWLSKIASEGYVSLEGGSRLSNLITFFRKNADKIQKLADMDLKKLEKELEKSKKRVELRKKRLKQLDKEIAAERARGRQLDARGRQLDKEIAAERARGRQLDKEIAAERARGRQLDKEIAAERARGRQLDRKLKMLRNIINLLEQGK